MKASIETVRRDIAQAQAALTRTTEPKESDRELVEYISRTAKLVALAAITLNERTSRG